MPRVDSGKDMTVPKKVGRSVYVWIVVALLALAAAITMAVFLPVVISIRFERLLSDEQGELVVSYLFGLIQVRKKLSALTAKSSDEGPAIAAEHKSPSPPGTSGSNQHTELTSEEIWQFIKQWRTWADVYQQSVPVIKKLLQRVGIDELSVRCRLGTGDVVSTGVAYGTFWGVLTTLVGASSYVCRFRCKPDLAVDADFQRAALEAQVRCIAKVRLGYAIVAGLRLARVWRRRTAHGTSHSRAYADGDGKHTRNG